MSLYRLLISICLAAILWSSALVARADSGLSGLFQVMQGASPADIRNSGAEAPQGAPPRQRLFTDTALRPAQYTSAPASEPLGFSQSHFDPGPSASFAPEAGVFDEPEPMLGNPYDLDAPAPTISSGSWLRNGFWYTQQSVVYMSRSAGVKNSIDLATDVLSAANPNFRSTLRIPIGLGYEPGLRLTLGRYVGRDDRDRDHTFEFTFLGLLHWQNGASLTASTPGSIFSNIDHTRTAAAFNGSNFQSFSETSDVNSYEFNYKITRRLSRDQMIYTRDSEWVRQATPAILPAIFAGVRAVTANESLIYLAEATAGNGAFNIHTHNNMVGPQIGVDLFYEHYEWTLGGRFKGGALVNWTDQTTNVNLVTSTRDDHARDHILGFVGEINFIGTYRFRPNCAFRASYDFLFLGNTTLAQNQINFVPSIPAQISDQHALFYQGGSIGLEFNR